MSACILVCVRMMSMVGMVLPFACLRRCVCYTASPPRPRTPRVCFQRAVRGASVRWHGVASDLGLLLAWLVMVMMVGLFPVSADAVLYSSLGLEDEAPAPEEAAGVDSGVNGRAAVNV